MAEIAKDVGIGIASGLGQEGIKLAAQRMFLRYANSKDPVIYFGLWCNFREMPFYDNARDALNEVVSNLERSGSSLVQGKNTFDYDISWRMLEGCEIPHEQWEYDAVIDEETNDFEEASSECVSGFVFWLWPCSLGERKSIIVSAYHILSQIDLKVQGNKQLPKMKTTSFAFVRANKETCLKIHSRLNSKINGNDETKGFLGTVDEAPLSENMMLLTVPLREFVVAKALADSFSIWGSIKK